MNEITRQELYFLGETYLLIEILQKSSKDPNKWKNKCFRAHKKCCCFLKYNHVGFEETVFLFFIIIKSFKKNVALPNRKIMN